MPSGGVSSLCAICLLALVLLPSGALADSSPAPGGPDLCLQNTPRDEPNPVPSIRSQMNFDYDFRGSSAGCGGGGILDGILGRGPWGRAAGTAIEAGRLMLGFDLDLRKLAKFGRDLGIAPKAAPDTKDISPQELEKKDEFEIKTHSSFVFRASRKRVFLGFGFQW